MIVVTLVVRSSWLSASRTLQPQELVLQDGEKKCTTFGDLIQNYEDTCWFVSSFQSIFQGWFVLQWIIYFIAITEECMLIFDTLIASDYQESRLEQDRQLGLLFAYLTFYISGFVSSLHLWHCNELLSWRLSWNVKAETEGDSLSESQWKCVHNADGKPYS